MIETSIQPVIEMCEFTFLQMVQISKKIQNSEVMRWFKLGKNLIKNQYRIDLFFFSLVFVYFLTPLQKNLIIIS